MLPGLRGGNGRRRGLGSALRVGTAGRRCTGRFGRRLSGIARNRRSGGFGNRLEVVNIGLAWILACRFGVVVIHQFNEYRSYPDCPIRLEWGILLPMRDPIKNPPRCRNSLFVQGRAGRSQARPGCASSVVGSSEGKTRRGGMVPSWMKYCSPARRPLTVV